ncbi:MAG: hypothetical protein ACXWXO_09240 [Nocardioides sp.]
MIKNAQRTMGLAGITAGATFFLGQGGELVFGDDSRPLFAVIVVLMGVAVVSFGVAFLAMRRVLHASRAGRIGATVGVVGDVFLLGFAVQLSIAAVRTGELPENFALFALGFLMVFVAHLVVARPLAAVIGGAWWLSTAAGVTLLAALVTNEIFIWHDLALFAFEACWVAIGALALKRTGQPLMHAKAPALS